MGAVLEHVFQGELAGWHLDSLWPSWKVAMRSPLVILPATSADRMRPAPGPDWRQLVVGEGGG